MNSKNQSISANFCVFSGKNKLAAEYAERRGKTTQFSESAEQENQIKANLEGLGL
jgi:hypothetical protein